MPTRALLVAMAVALAATSTLVPRRAVAEAERDRFSAGGYLRIATRPDFQGGNSRLGYWPLYGRLLNEGNWGALEMKLDLVQPEPDSDRAWTSLRAKIEGGSILTADSSRGVLGDYRVTQLYAQAGNLLLKDVLWQIGTLDSYFGDLGLYDMKPAQLLYETVGVSARYQKDNLDVLVGFGDSGYFMRGPQYNTILTGAASARLRLGGKFELGAGGQYMFEPKVVGNRFAPYTHTDLEYEDYARREVVDQFAKENPELLNYFPNPVPTTSSSWKAIGYFGFGDLGPLVWSNFYVNFLRRHPDQFYTEQYQGREYTIFIHDLTDERYQVNLGNEARFTLVPNRLDLAWGVLYGRHWDADNTVATSDDARMFASTVVRAQAYLTETIHALVETSYAYEESLNGNAYRNHADSIFRGEGGMPEDRGLEYGDANVRRTWQLKLGPVLNPLGTGIYSRPSLRILYGLQHSTQNNAFGNSFVDDPSQYNIFKSDERHWHHVLAVEAEAWF